MYGIRRIPPLAAYLAASLLGVALLATPGTPAMAATSLTGSFSRAEELDTIVTTVRDWRNAGVPAAHIGVCARSKAYVDTTVQELTRAGIDAASLARRLPSEAISVGTMHRMKGLEFTNMIVTGVAARQVPAPSAVTPADDDQVSHDYDMQRERCLLFVACTRAREQLVVTWSGERSPLLPAEPPAR